MRSAIFLHLLSLFVSSLLAHSTRAGAQEGLTFGTFANARSISVDPQGNIVVADIGANKVQKLDGAGKPVAEIGGYGWGELEFDQPYDACASNGLDIFVADYGNHRVQRYNRKLEYIATLYTRESPDESQRFGYPAGVAINRFGDLLLCDRENHRVLKISGFSRVVRSVGGIDAGKGRLVDPKQVEVGSGDNIYVLEDNRIVVFDNFGNYLHTIGRDTLRAASGFGMDQTAIFVIDRGALLRFDLGGRLVESRACTEFVKDGSQECVDVAVDPSRIIVLFRGMAVAIAR